MKQFMKTILLTVIASLVYVFGAQAASNNQCVITLSDGQKIMTSLPSNQMPQLPLTLPDATGKSTANYGANDIVSVELTDSKARIQGCRRWEVHKVATPSIMLGVKNTEKRLLGVVAENAGAKVYKWILTQQRGDNASDTHFGLWYGILPTGAEVVYPFIQDSKVWFRDMGIVLGKTNPDFVKTINAYYIKGKKKVTDERKEALKQRPASILDVLSGK